MADVNSTKCCTKCGEVKPLSDFEYRKDQDRYRASCRACRCKAHAEKSYPSEYINTDEKVCRACGEYKTADQFHKNGKMKDSLAHNCKLCACRISKDNRESNVARMLVQRTAYREKNRERLRLKAKDWRMCHPECVAAALENLKLWNAADPERARIAANRRSQKWIQRNKEKRAEIARNWFKNNRNAARAICANRRARKRNNGGKHVAADIKRLYELQRGRCACCGKRLSQYHVDHRIPLARGGSNWPHNLQLLCPRCNLTKGAKDPIEHARELGRLL